MPNVLRQPVAAGCWLIQAIVGIVCLLTLLTLAATIPVLNLLTLGYLIEVQGRVARTGKLGDGLPLLPAARRAGLVMLWIALFLVPVRWLAGAASDAWLISPGSAQAWLWVAGLLVVSLFVTAHLLLSLARGGGFWCFLRPLKIFLSFRAQLNDGKYWGRATRELCGFFGALQLVHHVRLAAFAYVGIVLWVAIPTAMFTAVSYVDGPWQRWLTLVGGLGLVPVLMWLPFLQTRFAAEGRFRALFELGPVRELFRRAPFTWALTLIVLYVTAFVPLFYIAKWKANVPPHETTWDVMLIFLVMIYPAKVMLGWSYHRATRRGSTRRSWQWANSLLATAATCGYVYLLFLGQTSGRLGHQPVWQHFALLLPLPWL
jgi:hypothetical protein